MRSLMNKDEWLERMWEEAFKDGESCETCEFLHKDCGWFPFDVEPRLQEWVCERECEAGEPMECPYVRETLIELAGEVNDDR